MDLNPKISIVVPIYNVENYLERSLNSLIKQTLTEIEIILVNDGSTDKSLEVCNKYAQIDSRILILDRSNEGVSSARNAGITVARGKYIGFVDPDDWVEENMFEKMYESIISSNAQIAMCEYIVERENQSPKVIKLSTNSTTLGREGIFQELILNMLAPPTLNSNSSPIMGSVWRVIIDRTFLIQHSIQFERNIPLMEDLIFILQCLIPCEKVIVLNMPLYHYLVRSRSAATRYRENFFELNKEVYRIISSLLEHASLKEKCESRLSIRYIDMCLNCVVNEVNSKETMKKRIKKIKLLCKDKNLKNNILNLDMYSYTYRKKFVLNSLKRENALILCIYYSLLKRM